MTLVASKPVSAVRAASRLRATSPDPISKSTETATCATTSAARARPVGPARRDNPSLMTARRSTRAPRHAGTKPNARALAHAASTENAIT